MTRGKLKVVKQEMARVNIDILGISKLKCIEMGGFNSDDHCIYYHGKDSIRRKGVAIIVNKAEIDVFLELSCFFHDPADVGNLISGSFAFSKSSLNIRKFTVHILLMPLWGILSITLLACEMSAIVW